MMYGQSNILPETVVADIEDTELCERAKHLCRCKNVLWSRWTMEYVRGLRERHNLKHNSKKLLLKIGDVVLIKSDQRNWGNIGVVVKLVKGRDGEIRAARLKTGKSYIERAIQQLCPMELSCDIEKVEQERLDPEAREFIQKRAAAVAAKDRVREMVLNEEEDGDN